jgi:hypothetical protein
MKTLLLTGIAALFLATGTARAATEVLTLACKGTVISRSDFTPGGSTTREPISMGIVVNFTSRTVHGFGEPAKITATETDIRFTSQSESAWGNDWYDVVMGAIDRVTGDVWASINTWKKESLLPLGEQAMAITYELKCAPTQRMF